MRRRVSIPALAAWVTVCTLAAAQGVPRPVSSGVSLQAAPNGAVAREGVLKQLPARLRERLEKPITDKATTSFLATRAAAFHLGGAAIPLTLDAANIVDMGADRPGEARFMSPVDLAKSPAALASITRGTGADTVKAHVLAVLGSHVAPVKGGYEYRDTLFVTVVEKDLSRVAMWRVENGSFRRLFDRTTAGAKPGTLASAQLASGALPSQLAFAATPASVASSSDAFAPGTAPAKRALGETCAGGVECTSGSCAPTSDASVALCLPNPGAPSSTSSCAELANAPAKCVPATGTGETGDFCTSDLQCKSKLCTGSSSGKKCAAPPPTTKKGYGETCAAASECALNVCTSARCVPPEGKGALGEFCNAASQCATKTCTASKCAAPPPTLYDAYGMTMCNHYCTSASCNVCCALWANAQSDLLILGAIACHLAAGIWIPAHFACAAGEAAIAATITLTTTLCSVSCSTPYPQGATANPNSCTLTK